MCVVGETHPLAGVSFFSYQADIRVYTMLMDSCPCIKSVKTHLTTRKWEGGCCECGKKLPLGHLIIVDLVELLLSVLVGAVVLRSRLDL